MVVVNGLFLRYGMAGGEANAAMTLKDDILLLWRELSFKSDCHKYRRTGCEHQDDAPCRKNCTEKFILAEDPRGYAGGEQQTIVMWPA